LSDDGAELRRIVAAEHGLDPKAAPLLVGETVEELDANAAALVRFVGERQEPEPELAQGFFARAAEAKARRKKELLALFSGRAPEQPRDERGRWLGFDGGARRAAPVRRPPEQEHNELVAELVSLGRTFGRTFP
jgi:hypothetical protein